MTALAKFLITLILSVFLVGCNFNLQIDPGVKGNGNVQTEERIVNQDFSSIKASNGLDVYITQSTDNLVKVQADENLLEIIKTEVVNGCLEIYTTEKIDKSESKKILVNFTDINAIKASSASHVAATNILNTEKLSLQASSAATVKLTAEVTNISCKASSAATIKLNGKTNYIEAKASSASTINAKNMLAENCLTDASSASSINVNCTSSIDAESSSASSIRYSGNPANVQKDNSSAGSIKAY
ncbi:head GIN domain-containing protein [Pseudofulvibacter geojedonensis]|uniref:Head GIN domain-containing protein n=1 Tax=Pseudofulvibacter geojedonensis TaxID=1123758 RepID=A0ABW3I5A5_9FLAO